MAQVLEVKMVAVVVTVAMVRSGVSAAALSAAGGRIGHNRERRRCDGNRSDGGGQKCAGGSHWRILGSGSSGETEPARANTTGRALHRDLLSRLPGGSRR